MAIARITNELLFELGWDGCDLSGLAEKIRLPYPIIRLDFECPDSLITIDAAPDFGEGERVTIICHEELCEMCGQRRRDLPSELKRC